MAAGIVGAGADALSSRVGDRDATTKSPRLRQIAQPAWIVAAPRTAAALGFGWNDCCNGIDVAHEEACG